RGALATGRTERIALASEEWAGAGCALSYRHPNPRKQAALPARVCSRPAFSPEPEPRLAERESEEWREQAVRTEASEGEAARGSRQARRDLRDRPGHRVAPASERQSPE